MCHSYTGNDYMGHNYIGHHYIGATKTGLGPSLTVNFSTTFSTSLVKAGSYEVP